MDKYSYWLDRVIGLGATSKRNLMEAFGSARAVYYGQENLIHYILTDSKKELFMKAKKEVEIERAYENLVAQEIKMVCYGEAEFPKKLKHIPDAPFGIYFKGELPKERLPSVAVIGARECSQYGEYIARELGKMLGIHGIQVISGMAKGIDGITQFAALEAGGNSYGVLGCGVDICYPKSNKKIYEQLIKQGGILSIYPPGTQPQSRLFPPRNRIVSGLADVLVVIEAKQRSGTAITVDMALEQGRDIYAVPGRVTDRLSDGCNKMLKEGAHVFLSPEDFLLDLQELIPAKMDQLINVQHRLKGETEKNKEHLTQNRNASKQEENQEDIIADKLLGLLDLYPKPVDKIMMGLSNIQGEVYKQEEIISKLMYLCMLGYVKQDSPGWFSSIIENKDA